MPLHLIAFGFFGTAATTDYGCGWPRHRRKGLSRVSADYSLYGLSYDKTQNQGRNTRPETQARTSDRRENARRLNASASHRGQASIGLAGAARAPAAALRRCGAAAGLSHYIAAGFLLRLRALRSGRGADLRRRQSELPLRRSMDARKRRPRRNKGSPR